MSLKFPQLSKVLRQVTRAGVVVISLSVSSFVNAASYGDGYTAYENEDYETALEIFRVLAIDGDQSSQAMLGWMHGEGLGVIQDYKQAVKWYAPAAEQGQVGAQYFLGVAYDVGKGVPQEFKQAVKWYTLAAKQGYVGAQFNVGNMHWKGLGVTQDDKQAAKWYTLAAEQGHASAQLKLGSMYRFGKGVIQDYSQAIKWYELAAAQGRELAQGYLEDMQEGKMTDWHFEAKEGVVTLYNLEESKATYITAGVSFSTKGNRSLYFDIEYDNLKCEITKDSEEPSTHIWYFNSQAVKMNAWCSKYPDSEVYNLSLTPKSYKGFNFVVSAFRKAPNTVAIKTDTLDFKMSAKGFTKVWNSVSSAAL